MKIALQNTRVVSVICIVVFFLAACSQMDDLHEKYLQDEIIYLSVSKNIKAMPGNKRIKLRWIMSPDSRITQSRIVWKTISVDSVTTDSLTFDTAENSVIAEDTVTVEKIVPVPEGDYEFTVYSISKKALQSLKKTIFASVYGPVYQKTLNNRKLRQTKVDLTGVELGFYGPSAQEVGLNIRYTNTNNDKKQIILAATGMQNVKITDYKFDTPIIYSSLFLPVKTAIDTFTVLKPDTLTFSQP